MKKSFIVLFAFLILFFTPLFRFASIAESGQNIGSAGGQVISSDGKIKLVVPPNALSATYFIEVSSVDPNTMQGTQPTGKALLSVVECTPVGLTFSIPATLTYTLLSAEVPGTPVELGLYDSGQNKILTTGQTSTVQSDGYTVDFSHRALL